MFFRVVHKKKKKKNRSVSETEIYVLSTWILVTFVAFIYFVEWNQWKYHGKYTHNKALLLEISEHYMYKLDLFFHRHKNNK